MSTNYNPVIAVGIKLKPLVSEEVSCTEQRPATLRGVPVYDKEGVPPCNL